MTQKPEEGRLRASHPQPTEEPIAIIGIGCRFPGGANGPDAFWRLLCDGVDAITDIPADRWRIETFYDPEPGTPGKTNTCRGGFVEGIDRFDATFFGISPREAARMDPQHRLLLEVAWEALEDAGQVAERLAGTNTGVFIGISTQDYMVIQQASNDSIDAHTTTGSAMSIAANHISFCLNLRGPSIALDTACSSSLVAVHVACQSLWHDGCALALAGGVNVLITPETYVGFSRLSMLSPDGRCKAFDAGANGFVRGEGAGIIVLKRLSQALKDGDQIYALIRGSAVNQDGRTSGLTVPSQSAQEGLVREACRRAGISPSQVQFIEAHGTGTLVGDPIEAKALGAALADNRPQGSYWTIGSVKTNIGHLEAAAGIAGLIKVALALKHRMIPPNLHFNQPNPDIPFDHLRLRVQRTLEPWPEQDAPAFAGVNSFGFGGTNAHVILQGAPRLIESETNAWKGVSVDDGSEKVRLVPLSARSGEALKAVAQSYREYLSTEGPASNVSLGDLCWTLSCRRSHHDHRLAIVARSKEVLVEHLEAFVAGETRAGMASGRHIVGQHPRLVFVFSGQGSQWWAMGRELLEREPVFRQMIEECDELISEHGSWSLMKELTADESCSRLEETAIAQPAIFALQVGLAELWQSWGIKPDGVVGHSVGEVAAAYVSGALSLKDAVRVAFHRGRCMDFAAAHGRMLAVGLPVREVDGLVEREGDRISIAAINSPTAVTLSGDGELLGEVAQALEQRGVFCRFVRVNYAFHSPLMDPVRTDLLDSLQAIEPRRSSLPFYSTVTGRPAEGIELDADYWWQTVRMTVRFGEAVDGLLQDGYNVFLELAPHPVLSSYVTETIRERQANAAVLHSLRRGEEERSAMLKSLGALYVLGSPVDWEGLSHKEGRLVRLPSYPWQRESYWSEAEESKQHRLGSQVHPLLGKRLISAYPTWENRVDLRVLRYLNDHRVQGHVLLSATSFLEMALAAAREMFGAGPRSLEEVELLKACYLEPGEPKTIQFIANANEMTFNICSRPQGGNQPWTEHVKGKMYLYQGNGGIEQVNLDEIRARCTEEVAGDEVYRKGKEVGLDFGPSFRGLERLWVGQGEALGHIRAPEKLQESLSEYEIHPALMDACLQITGALISPAKCGTKGPGLYVPVEFRQVRLYGHAAARLWSHARLVERNSNSVVFDVRVTDEAGKPVLDVRGLRSRSIDSGRHGTVAEDLSELLYGYEWQLKPRSGQVVGFRAATHLPSPSCIHESTKVETERLAADFGFAEKWEGFERQTDALCTALIVEAFRKLGVDLQPQQRMTTDTLAQRLGIASRHTRVLNRYVGMLEADGVLRKIGSEWEVCLVPDMCEDPERAWQKLLISNPASYAELMLLGRCGLRLAQILRGDVDPLHLIFPDGSLAIAEHLYQDSWSLRFNNIVTQRAIIAMLGKLPEGRTIRLLEIGAGTGGLTSYLLPKLPADRAEYVFTDVSNHFLVKAEEKFRDVPFIKYQHLDIEADPGEQGFEPHSFDVVVASLVLHATADLRHTLKNINRLIASEGMLVLIEVVRPTRWHDMVFGLTDGWWRFSDENLRPFYPTLPFPRWRALLEEMGLADVCEVSRRGDQEDVFAVILARGPRLEWDEPAMEQEVSTGPETGGVDRWIILADRSGFGHKLAVELRRRGERCVMVFPGDAYQRQGEEQFEVCARRPEGFRRLLQDVIGPDGPACRGVVHLWNLDAPSMDDTTMASLDETLSSGCLSVVHLAQALSDVDVSKAPRLWVVTRGAQSVGKEAEATAAAQAAVWGLGRVIVNEVPKLRAAMVDLSATGSDDEIRSLCEEVLLNDEEDEIALRGDARYVHRFVRLGDQYATEVRELVRGGTQPFRLESSRTGILDKLILRASPRRPPYAGEVEIQVAAAGLNFSDVMNALGILPGLTDGLVPLGIECAGRLSAIGPEVEGYEIGDEVIAIAPFSIGAYVTTAARFVAPKPLHHGFEEAATLPIAFLTAHYALNHLGRLSKGERVLIHSATGGVGLASIQLARQAGAEIFATAGTAEKREFLRFLGIEHVMDSRSLEFADEVMERTEGQGVDVVLNSLAGEAISKGLSILREYGRFLEIGKRDIYQNSRLGLRPFQRNLSFIAIDLDRVLRERPALISSLFQGLVGSFRDGMLSPLPHRVFPISNAVSAFRYMAQAKHIGKVVISLQERELPIVRSSEDDTTFRNDATYLVTGGLGGFGLALAQWMIDRGVRHLVLMGRRGVHSAEAHDSLEAMRQAGAEVMVAKADIASQEQVAGVLADIEESMPPLRGVFHAAMVLDDRVLLNLNEECMREVWAPKVTGAWNLHAKTLNRQLDFFVLFSSMASVLGTGGQGNYASANAFLDSLAYYRRARGLPGTTVSWGALSEVGWIARHGGIEKRYEAQGFLSLSPKEALTLLGRLLHEAPPHVAILRMAWERTGATSPRFAHLVREGGKDGADFQKKGGLAVRSALLAAEPSERREMIESLLREQVARVLGTSPTKLDTEKPLTQLGLDSLMGFELRNWIEGELRLSLPMVELMRGPSVVRLAELLVNQLSQSESAATLPPPTPQEPPEQVLEKVDQLSDEQVETLLRDMLDGTAREAQKEGELN